MEPQLAKDVDLKTLRLPVWLMPKIDGVRSLHVTGQLTGRSLDPFEGYGITEYFSKPEFAWLDGEMTLGDNPAADALCRTTTGAMGRFKNVTEMADIHWWCFDLLDEASRDLPYRERYANLRTKVAALKHKRVHLVPYEEATTMEDVLRIIASHAAAGYEGTIFRNPDAQAKEGRPTKRGQELLRAKPWDTAEILVTGITEGEENQNEAKTNTLGRTERSSAKAGKVPNGRVGSIQGTMVADYVSPITGKLLFPKDLPVTISKGAMTEEEALHYFKHQDEIVNHIVKFKHMIHGVFELPRMGGYVSHRLKQDR